MEPGKDKFTDRVDELGEEDDDSGRRSQVERGAYDGRHGELGSQADPVDTYGVANRARCATCSLTLIAPVPR